MPTIPKATTSVSEAAGAVGSGLDQICVIAPVPTLDDGKPRVYGSADAIYSAHGYSEGVEYAALHSQGTRKPIIFCGIPIATAGAVSNEVITGNTGTSVVTLTEGADGTLTEHNGVLKVVAGGTIGTDHIRLSLSLDGGRTYQPVRLGTANSYVVPYVGLTIAFAAGTLVTGDTIHTWDASGPVGNAAGYLLARTELAKTQLACRTWIVIGDMADATNALAVNTQAEAYATSNDRFVAARVSAREPGAGETTKALWMAGITDDYETVDAAPRIAIGAGRGRLLSPITGWYWRRNVIWSFSIREYQKDVHISPWRKSDGPTGADLYDADGNLVEWDDYTDGSAGLAARFVTFRTYANGPAGAYIALGLSRAAESSLTSYTHNQAVIDLARTIVQRATENAVIGRIVALNDDGTAQAAELKQIESEVNSALIIGVLSDRGFGPRASKAVWQAATDDILNVPEAILNGTLTLNLNGTIHSVATTIKIVSGGQ